jgi:hypothetical protein
LLNNKFMLRMAEHFAEHLTNIASVQSVQIDHALQLATGRQPTSEQLTMLTEYVNEFGMENLCRLLFNLNEFVFVD